VFGPIDVRIVVYIVATMGEGQKYGVGVRKEMDAAVHGDSLLRR